MLFVGGPATNLALEARGADLCDPKRHTIPAASTMARSTIAGNSRRLSFIRQFYLSRQPARFVVRIPCPDEQSGGDCFLLLANQLKNVENFFVALKWRNEIRAGQFRARPRQHLAREVEAAIACGGAGRFERSQHLLRNDDTGNLVV